MEPRPGPGELWIPGELVDLNTYIRLERSNKYAAAKAKRGETETCMVCALERRMMLDGIGLPPYAVTCIWFRSLRKKDPDNIAFAIKFILDGLVAAGVLENDGWRQIHSLQH
ncbi:MAG: hypothetical protein JXQ75_12030, partial [Phycisphaerae bacterium]|nr:hypothetical protein [Phycisphaerae bacterium]